MFKDATNADRYPWIEAHVEALVKDTRKDLKKDVAFTRQNFPGKVAQKLTIEEMVPVYSAKLSEGDAHLWEFLAERWLLKHTDIYYYFESKLKSLAEDFSELEEIDVKFASEMMEESSKEHGAENTLLFAVLNSVVFPKSVYKSLKEKALKELSSKIPVQDENQDLEALVKKQELEIKRIENRYEKKLSGMERKYLTDTEALKKQISTLQKKLNVSV